MISPQMISGALDIHGPKVVFTIPFINVDITESVVVGWLLIIAIAILCKYLTHNLKVKPETKRQVIAEYAVEFVNKSVRDSMGEEYMCYAPYIATLLVYAALGSLVSIIGLRSITADVNVTISWALITFVLIVYTRFKNKGFVGFFKTFTEPVAVITPINIISEFATPVSMAFRLFGNVAGGMVITGILYMALGGLSELLHLSFSIGGFTVNIASIGIPGILSIYFDLFVGCIQAYIFATLTMVNVAGAAD